MKLLPGVILVLSSSFAIAGSLQIKNPVEASQRTFVPVDNIRCKPGPFRMASLELTLSEHLGSADQSEVLLSGLFGFGGGPDCPILLKRLQDQAGPYGEIPLEVRILSRSVIRTGAKTNTGCELAEQEILTATIEGEPVETSVVRSHEEVACPNASRDGVIYVLNENGVPTKSAHR